METRTDLREFEELVKKIDRSKYHIGRELTFSPEGFYISNWSIFRKICLQQNIFLKIILQY